MRRAALPAGGQRSRRGRHVPPAGDHVARGPAVPRHLPGVQRRERGPGRRADGRADGARRQPGGHRRQGAPRSDSTPYEILTIASMIEEEAKVAEDRPKIARVIYNRLALGMPLQIDATLLLRAEPRPGDRRELLAASTRRTTRTSTPGLPATPISNPGRASIQAALNPAPNPSVGDPLCQDLPEDVPCEYLYYVLANEEGGHAFAVTGEQHAANVAAAAGSGPARRDCSMNVAGGDRLAGRPLAVAGDPQRRVPGRRARLGVRRLRRRARAGAPRRSTRCGCSASRGLSVTTPHKEDVAAAVDELAPAAAALRSVNTVVVDRRRAPGRPQHRRRRLRRRARRRRRRASAAPRSPWSGRAPPARSVIDALGRAGAGDDRRRQPHGRNGPTRQPRSPRRHGSARPPTSPRPTSSSTPRRSASAPTSCRSTRRCCGPSKSSPTSSTTRSTPRCCEPRPRPRVHVRRRPRRCSSTRPSCSRSCGRATARTPA